MLDHEKWLFLATLFSALISASGAERCLTCPPDGLSWMKVDGNWYGFDRKEGPSEYYGPVERMTESFDCRSIQSCQISRQVSKTFTYSANVGMSWQALKALSLSIGVTFSLANSVSTTQTVTLAPGQKGYIGYQQKYTKAKGDLWTREESCTYFSMYSTTCRWLYGKKWVDVSSPVNDQGTFSFVNEMTLLPSKDCTQWGWKFYDGYDMNGNDLGWEIAGHRNECQDKCRARPGCRAYTWGENNRKYCSILNPLSCTRLTGCWLKTRGDMAMADHNAYSAVIC